MEPRKNRPKLKLTRKPLDWTIEFLAFLFLLIQIVIPIVYYNQLPETIPTHFNGAGQPDGFGSRSTLWILPVTSLFMYLLMTVVESFPQIYNYPVEITPENAVVQYRIATRLIRILKTIILMIFSFITYQTIKTATGAASGLGKAFLPIFLLLTFGVIIVYIVHSLNNRQSS
jgi:uncharacterized membrane protein